MGQVPRSRRPQALRSPPSQQDASVRYLADLNGCTCPDFQRRQQACKHVLAIRLHCALVQVQAQRRQEGVRPTA